MLVSSEMNLEAIPIPGDYRLDNNVDEGNNRNDLDEWVFIAEHSDLSCDDILCEK